MTFTFVCNTTDDTKQLAAAIGRVVKGGELLAFASDLGGGKTTFVKGLAQGMGVTDVVQSPTFTISQLHKAARGLELHHFDFYRLDQPGVMRAELAESLAQPNAVVALEWGDIVHDILPADRLTINLAMQRGDARAITLACPKTYLHITDALRAYQNQRTMA